MKQKMYERLVGVIHRHRTWIGVAEWDKTHEMMAVVNDKTKRVTCKVLVLFSREKKGVYPKGYSWNIPEMILDKAVVALKLRDKSFKSRWKSETITPDDAEFIINHASHGFLSLHLKSIDQLNNEYNGQMD